MPTSRPGSRLSALHRAYRRTGATLPFGDLLSSHDVAMEGYFWRFTDPATGRVVIALNGVNRDAHGRHWTTLGVASHPGGHLRTVVHPESRAGERGLGASAGDAFDGGPEALRVDLGEDTRLQSGSPARGTAVLGTELVEIDGWDVYAEKNWGKGGFPDSWWWGQAQGFEDPSVCVAFAGGDVSAGPLRTTVTGLVVLLPGGRLVRLGDPVVSPVRARVTDEHWSLRGRSAQWQIEGHGALGSAHVLPVPLPFERRNVPGAVEHLGATMEVTVRHRGRLVWSGESRSAALEHGGIDRARAEVLRRGGNLEDTDAAPQR